MNWWWILFIPLGCLWVLPMLGTHQANMPKIFYVAVASLWMSLFLFARPLYDWGTSLLRKLGLTRLADLRDRFKPKVLSPVRVALLIMAIVSIVFVLL